MIPVATEYACDLCGAQRARPIFSREMIGVRWQLCVCGDCGLEFTVPYPTDSQLQDLYSGDYHQELRTPGATERAFGDKFARYAAAIARSCPPGRALDVGCSTGLLVRMLCDRGFEAEGLELNAASAAWGSQHYQVKIQNEALREGLFPDSSFQLVTMADVLEHTVTPLSFLRLVRRILKPGGYMFVSFPDIHSLESRYWRLMSKLTGRAWLWSNCHIPLHIWEFTRATAERMFREAGFQVIECHRSQPPVEKEKSWLRWLSLPMQLLQLPGAGRWCGTQMEFVIRRAD